MLYFPASKLGRMSSKRQTEVIKEVKALEKQKCMRTVPSITKDRNDKLNVMINNLRDMFDKMTSNNDSYVRSLNMEEEKFKVSISLSKHFFTL